MEAAYEGMQAWSESEEAIDLEWDSEPASGENVCLEMPISTLNRKLIETLKTGNKTQNMDVQEVKRLLLARADANDSDRMPLLTCCDHGKYDTKLSRNAVRLLLQAKADPNGPHDALSFALSQNGGMQIIGSDNRHACRNKWLIPDFFAAGCQLTSKHFHAVAYRNDSEKTLDGIQLRELLLHAAAKHGQSFMPGKEFHRMYDKYSVEGFQREVVHSFADFEEKCVQLGLFDQEDVQKQQRIDDEELETRRLNEDAQC